MNVSRRTTPLALLAATLLAAVAAADCGGSTTQPTTALAMSGVTLNATVVAVGGTVQGTVSFATAAPTGGASIALSSSNASVATVQTPITIQPGASSATFTVTGVAPGTATFTASSNGTSQSPMLTVTAPAALASITLSASSVVGANPVVGTATLTGVAPAGGAMVSLSGGDPLVGFPTTVTVPAGSTSMNFTIETRAVAGTLSATISGTYGGTSKSATLSVVPFVPTVATASFGVTGRSGTDTCQLVDNGNSLDCFFDGSTSTSPGTIVAWDWSYTVATTISHTTTGPKLAIPVATCALVPSPPLPAGTSSFPLTVRLTIHDSLGNVGEAVHTGARVLPQGVCGF